MAPTMSQDEPPLLDAAVAWFSSPIAFFVRNLQMPAEDRMQGIMFAVQCVAHDCLN
jgi:hypothetical protein